MESEIKADLTDDTKIEKKLTLSFICVGWNMAKKEKPPPNHIEYEDEDVEIPVPPDAYLDHIKAYFQKCIKAFKDHWRSDVTAHNQAKQKGEVKKNKDDEGETLEAQLELLERTKLGWKIQYILINNFDAEEDKRIKEEEAEAKRIADEKAAKEAA